MVVQDDVGALSLDEDVSVPGHQMCVHHRRGHLQRRNHQEMTLDYCYDR